jgi:hypothetical protein
MDAILVQWIKYKGNEMTKLEIFSESMHFLWMCLVIFQICKLNKAVGELMQEKDYRDYIKGLRSTATMQNPDPTYPKPPPPPVPPPKKCSCGCDQPPPTPPLNRLD